MLNKFLILGLITAFIKAQDSEEESSSQTPLGFVIKDFYSENSD
jgi:hypothetical protein